MISNIVHSTARHHSVWATLGTCYPLLLCFGVLTSVAAGLSAVAKEAPNTIAGAQDALAPGKRPHIRQPVSARLPPYQAVGRLNRPMNCTGTIVLHPRIVVTAAHCTLGMTAEGPLRNVSFELWNQTTGGVRRFEARIRAVGSMRQHGPQSVHDASQDWAVLVLNEAPQGVRPLGIAEYKWPALESKRGRISLPTYAGDGDESAIVSVDPSCSIQGFQWEVLVHDCAAGAGGSGAPLLIDEGDCYRVVGIYSGTMLRDVDGDHTLKPIGNAAVGAWNFAGSVRALAHQLEVSEGRASADRAPSDTCPVVTAGYRAGLRTAVTDPTRGGI
jgi:V8-like Glu-specific endopeptidase